MLSIIFFSMIANASVKCDLTHQLSHLDLTSKKQSTSLAQQMIDESKTQQMAIDKLNKINVKNAYDVYLNSELGKKSALKIEKLREQLEYDAISYYLFDNPSFNSDVEPYEAKVVIDKKRYYLRNNQVIAILEPDQKSWILRRFDSNCHQKEAVGFTSLDVSDDSHLDYRINPQLCAMKKSRSITTLNENQLEKVNSMVNSTIDNKDAIRLRNRQIEAQCSHMTNPNAKKSNSNSTRVNSSN